MKCLIQNYSTRLSTEAMYFHTSLKHAGCESNLWADASISAYDIFDSFKPDVFICHFMYITDDIIKYLSSHKQITMVVNITGCDDNSLKIVEETLLSAGVNCKLLFTNTHGNIKMYKTDKIKIANIMPGLDVFLPTGELPLYQVGAGIITFDRSPLVEDVIKNRDSYHLISVGESGEGFDFHLNLKDLVSIYDKYEEIFLVGDISFVLSQLFFEATYRSKTITLKVPKEQQSIADNTVSSLFKHVKDVDLQSLIKAQILSKHNCFNRTSRLAKLIGDETLSNKLREMGESFK